MYYLFLFFGVGVFAYNIRRIWYSPPVSVWSVKRWYTTVTIFIMAGGFLLLGTQENFPELRTPAHTVMATGFIMMTIAPCSIRGFNDKKIPRIFRGLAFLELALIVIVNLY